MRKDTLRGVWAWSLITFLIVGFPPLKSSDDGTSKVQVVSVGVKMLNNKVELRLKVINRSDRPVFLAGSNFDRPEPAAVFLEQWGGGEGWTAVAPCLDVPPGNVISLDPGKAIASGYDLKVLPPKLGVCKAPNLQFGGRFRYRVIYFMSKKEAQIYAEHVYSPSLQPPGAHVALSEPFEIPPAKK